MASPFAALEGARYVRLTSYRRNGDPVHTPFGPMFRDGKVYCFTNAAAGKVKRVRREGEVELAPCTQRGQTTGPSVEGRARVLDGAQGEALAAAFQEHWLRQFKLLWRIGRLVERLRGTRRVVIEVAPA